MSLAPYPTGLFAKISAGSGKCTPHGSAIRASGNRRSRVRDGHVGPVLLHQAADAGLAVARTEVAGDVDGGPGAGRLRRAGWRRGRAFGPWPASRTKQAHLCRLMRLLCRMVICPQATPQPAGVSIPRTLSRFEDIRGRTPGGLDRHALRAGGGDKTKQNPRLDAPRAKGVAVVRHYRASGAEPLAINIRPGQIIRAFVHLAATSIEQIERAAGHKSWHPPPSSAQLLARQHPGLLACQPPGRGRPHRQENDRSGARTQVALPSQACGPSGKSVQNQPPAASSDRTPPEPKPRVVLIHSCGMPCIIASSFSPPTGPPRYHR